VFAGFREIRLKSDESDENGNRPFSQSLSREMIDSPLNAEGIVTSKVPSGSDSVPMFFSNNPILTKGMGCLLDWSITLPTYRNRINFIEW